MGQISKKEQELLHAYYRGQSMYSLQLKRELVVEFRGAHFIIFEEDYENKNIPGILVTFNLCISTRHGNEEICFNLLYHVWTCTKRSYGMST